MPRLQSDVERVTADAFYADLSALETSELRRRKEEAEAVEGLVSYARRIVQGRLDTYRFDPAALGTNQGSLQEEGLSRLSNAIGSNAVGTAGFGRFVDVAMSSDQIGYVETELDAVFEEARRAAKSEGEASAEDADLELRVLRSVEVLLSNWRRALFRSIDAVRAELVVRYRGDATMVDNLLDKVIHPKG